MRFNSDYFSGAQQAVMQLLKKERPGLMKYHGNVPFELKDDLSVVTNLDKELETKLKDVLKKYDSGVGFLGEEHGREGNADSYWLVDPIDGTENFIRGLASCRNMLTFVDGSQTQFALVYRFTTDDLFVAERSGRTTKNGQPVKLSSRPLDRSWLEFSVAMTQPDGYQLYKKLRPKIAGITVHHDFLEVLEGNIEGQVVYRSDGKLWDYGPRTLLVSQAGGKAVNFDGNDYQLGDEEFVAVTPSIFDELQKLLSR